MRPYLRAKLRLFPDAPITIVERFRPNWWVPQKDADDVLTDGLVYLEERKILRPGEKG